MSGSPPYRWTVVKRTSADSGPRPSPAEIPDATLRELVDVLAVGQSRRIDSTTITLLSVERYADGFVAQFRVLYEYTPPLDAALVAPQITVEAGDDRGGRYTGWSHGGSGGGGRGVLEWRFAYRFAPALGPAARELRLEVKELRWRRFEKDAAAPVVAETQSGPWAFTVALPPGNGSGERSGPA